MKSLASISVLGYDYGGCRWCDCTIVFPLLLDGIGDGDRFVVTAFTACWVGHPARSLSLSSQIVQPQKRVLCQVLHFWSVLWWARYLCQVNEIQHLSELGQTVGWDEFGDCFNVVPKVNLWKTVNTVNLVHFTYEECQHRMVFLTVFVVHLKNQFKWMESSFRKISSNLVFTPFYIFVFT